MTNNEQMEFESHITTNAIAIPYIIPEGAVVNARRSDL